LFFLEGEFGKNTYINFRKFLKDTNINTKEIKISSNGGVLSSAMRLGAFIHEHGWSTGIDKEMHCYSACGFVYFAGNKKSLEGKAKVGLHRPYIPGVADTQDSVRSMKREYLSYWNYIRASKVLYDEMMDTDRDDLLILDRDNIDEYIEDIEIR